MKKYAFGLSALVLAIAFSAFTVKPFTTATYQYTPTERMIATGDPLSLVVTDMVQANYAVGLPSVTFTADATYFRGFQIDEESTSDGGSDGQLSKIEAIAEIKSFYNTNHTLPNSLTVGTAVIVIRNLKRKQRGDGAYKKR